MIHTKFISDIWRKSGDYYSQVSQRWTIAELLTASKEILPQFTVACKITSSTIGSHMNRIYICFERANIILLNADSLDILTASKWAQNLRYFKFSFNCASTSQLSNSPLLFCGTPGGIHQIRRYELNLVLVSGCVSSDEVNFNSRIVHFESACDS